MTRRTSKIAAMSMIATGALLLGSLPAAAADDTSSQPVLNRATAFGVTAPLRELAKLPQPAHYGFHDANPVRRIPKRAFEHVNDPAEQHNVAPAAAFNLNYHVLGVGNGFPGYSVPDAPPDTTMAVGDWPGNQSNAQIVQWVNVSYAVYNKATGAALTGAVTGNSLWSSGLPGTLCANNNDGDIIAKFDRDAHRWVLTQNVFTSPYAVCIAVSTSPDATGSYYTYQFPVLANGFPDYPKWGIWSSHGASDGYYENWNNFGPGGGGFQGPVMCGYDRTKLLAGDNRDSPTPPPITEDEFFIGSVGDIDNAHLSLYSMHITNWATGQATMTGIGNSQPITVASYNGSCSGQFGGACVPQKGISDRVDSLGDRLMYRFAYWEDVVSPNFNPNPPIPATVQHWFVNGDVESSSGQIGVRWYEFIANQKTVPVTSLQVFQQGTYAGVPGDSNYRWMGSLTRDNQADILVGYSESSSNMYPSIAVAGRKFTDTLGTLSPEVFSVNGTGSQPTTGNRWGDYSTMAIDPADNCTFFYTTEYYMVTQQFDWSTDISSWKFPTCH
jgi:hypothetical protein